MTDQVDAVRTVNGFKCVAKRAAFLRGDWLSRRFKGPHQMCGDTLILVLIVQKRRVGSLHDITHIGIHCPVAGNKFVNQEGRCQNDDAC
ncbi:hypothetical protein SAEN8230_11300 [Salmonella enterica subsp. arizonae]